MSLDPSAIHTEARSSKFKSDCESMDCTPSCCLLSTTGALCVSCVRSDTSHSASTVCARATPPLDPNPCQLLADGLGPTDRCYEPRARSCCIRTLIAERTYQHLHDEVTAAGFMARLTHRSLQLLQRELRREAEWILHIMTNSNESSPRLRASSWLSFVPRLELLLGCCLIDLGACCP